MLLGGPLGAISQFIYVLLGILGIPVFAGGKAGWSIIAGPMGGFLLGFIIAAFFIGIVNQMKRSAGIFWHIFSMSIGMLIINSLGALQLPVVVKMSFHKALVIGVLPFAPGDIIKILLAAIVSAQFKGRIKV